MKKLIVFIILLNVVVVCKNKAVIKQRTTQKDTIRLKKTESSTTIKDGVVDDLYSKKLDFTLACDSFVYLNDYYRIPDYGCIYDSDLNPKNILGMADVLLLLKHKDKSFYKNYSEDELYHLEDSISKMKIEEKKVNFIPIVFVVEKEELKKNVNSEIKYSPTFPYTKKCFVFKNKRWFLVDSLLVNSKKQVNIWINKKINLYKNN
ncbi:hypothetical protein [uncultured Tenacibaculum sp.]|uniref:hypothetical protein n=1 Tax=uncultured Tenacibaculum sp. TaxID=174713 RepID=UPI002635AFFF|nr:hypothetical protein [uncultured Tenacibaculum sp.]